MSMGMGGMGDGGFGGMEEGLEEISPKVQQVITDIAELNDVEKKELNAHLLGSAQEEV